MNKTLIRIIAALIAAMMALTFAVSCEEEAMPEGYNSMANETASRDPNRVC